MQQERILNEYICGITRAILISYPEPLQCKLPLIFLKIHRILSRPLVEAQLTGLSIKISYRFWPAFSFLLWHQEY